MKFIINAMTVSNTNEQLIKELRPLKHLFGGEWDEIVAAIRDETEVDLKHVSITHLDGEWIVRVDDEVFTKQIALIGKAMRLFAPIIFTIKMVAKEIDSDLRALASWLREEK